MMESSSKRARVDNSTSNNWLVSDGTGSSSRKKRVKKPCSTELIYLIRTKQWDLSIERLLHTSIGKYEACQINKLEGRYPIHYLCQHNDGLSSSTMMEVMKILIDIYPDGLYKQDKYHGYLPLHLAVRNKHSNVGIISLLIHKYPYGLQQKTTYNFLPIHFAVCHCTCSLVDVLKIMIETYPNGLQKEDCFGRLPIHNICFNVREFSSSQNRLDGNTMIKILKLFLNAYPESIILSCNNCNIYIRPIEIAMECKAPSNVIQFLIEIEEMYIISLASSSIITEEKKKTL